MRVMVLVLAIVTVSGCATSTRKTFGLALIASSTVAALGFTGYAGFQQSKADDIYHVKGYSYVDGAALKEGIWQAWGIQMGVCAAAAIAGGLLAVVGGEKRSEPSSPDAGELEALAAARSATGCSTLVVVDRKPIASGREYGQAIPLGMTYEIHGCGRALRYQCSGAKCFPAGAEKR